jgi:predicted amidohydrolase YtcJ
LRFGVYLYVTAANLPDSDAPAIIPPMNASQRIDRGSADLIFTNGRVHIVDGSDHEAEALAIAGDRILQAGSNATVRALAGPSTRRIDLAGRSLLPGFIDAHCHYVWLGNAQAGIDCKAPGMNSIGAILEAVRERASRLPSGAWIRGSGYDQTKLAERRHPNRNDLDTAAPRNPVVLTRTCAHICAANSLALELAGIDDATPDPPAGRFDRYEGRNLGVAYEQAQAPLLHASAPSDEELVQALIAADRLYLNSGVTSVHDAGGLTGRALGLAQEGVARGDLWTRLYAFTLVGLGSEVGLSYLETGIRTGFGDDRLRIGAFKVVADGSSSGPTAATRRPYASNPSDSGILYWRQSELNGMIGRAHRAGFQVTMHTLGDRAIEEGLDAIELALRECPRPDPRPRLEHCCICPPDLQARVCALGVTPAMQPAFFWEFGDGYLTNYGRERADVMFPVRSLMQDGVRVAGSSDAPVTDHRPLFGIEQSITRATANGEVCGADERVDLRSAIRMYTTNAAYAAFEDGFKGSLEPGKLADLVVLDADITRVPAQELRDLPVAMTVSGGRIVYER